MDGMPSPSPSTSHPTAQQQQGADLGHNISLIPPSMMAGMAGMAGDGGGGGVGGGLLQSMDDEVKMVIVVRHDLGMSVGKVAAQSVHAALGVLRSANELLSAQW